MHEAPKEIESGGIGSHLAKMADGLAKLIAQHFSLARMEAIRDVKRIGMVLAGAAVFVPFVLVGYGFLCAAVAVWLAEQSSWLVALSAVGALNAAVGVVGVAITVRRLKGRQVMDDTVDELRRSADLLVGRSGGAVPHDSGTQR